MVQDLIKRFKLFIYLIFVVLVISRFGFEGWIWVLIASVIGLLTTFYFLCVQNVVFFSSGLQFLYLQSRALFIVS